MDDARERAESHLDVVFCAECGRSPVDPDDAQTFRLYSDGTGELVAFCPECAEREFGSPGATAGVDSG